jgi:hypothetical protein
MLIAWHSDRKYQRLGSLGDIQMILGYFVFIIMSDVVRRDDGMIGSLENLVMGERRCACAMGGTDGVGMEGKSDGSIRLPDAMS